MGIMCTMTKNPGKFSKTVEKEDLLTGFLKQYPQGRAQEHVQFANRYPGMDIAVTNRRTDERIDDEATISCPCIRVCDT